MNISKLNAVLTAEPKYRYAQVNKALWQDFVSSWDNVSSLPKTLRGRLSAACPLEIKAQVFKAERTNQGAKALITLEDGETIETVLIHQKGKGETTGRNTICVSSQVGCPLGCVFCATGANGFGRNLTAEEIIEQVIFWARYLKQQNNGTKVDNLVFMGMGEPFLNYDQFMKAVKFLNNPETLNIGARRLSVSTVGIIEGIKRLAGEKLQINLAISLHAPDDSLRRDLIPVAKKYPLREIFKAVDNYIAKTGRRVMFEYLMMKGINDSEQQAEELAVLMKKPLYLVNLIPYNETGKFKPSTRERIADFKKVLEDNNVPTTVRLSFGTDINAACGQLRVRKNNKEKK